MEKIREQFEEVRQYFEFVEDALRLGDVNEASGWAKALREESEKLEEMLDRADQKRKKVRS